MPKKLTNDNKIQLTRILKRSITDIETKDIVCNYCGKKYNFQYGQWGFYNNIIMCPDCREES